MKTDCRILAYHYSKPNTDLDEDDDNDHEEPEYWYCQSCEKTFLTYPGSNPCWDGGCSIDGVY